jgi:hypothetical protein
MHIFIEGEITIYEFGVPLLNGLNSSFVVLVVLTSRLATQLAN